FPRIHFLPMRKSLTQKPTIKVPLLKAGKKAEISCKVPGDCTSPMADIVWTGIYGETSRGGHGVPYQEENFSFMTFLPKPEHHNTKLTCAVTLQGRIRTESTVILKVRCIKQKMTTISKCLELFNTLATAEITKLLYISVSIFCSCKRHTHKNHNFLIVYSPSCRAR
uniref:Uncharacterized protein n=2 Tax=Cyprinus carpio TaxID=7962 RepID=A0A8C1CVH7_CYPCA